MKIGDKVRFLSEVGGGIVRGFQGKDIALVEGEDGFEIPMLIRECVVIQTDDYNIPLKSVAKPAAEAVAVESSMPSILAANAVVELVPLEGFCSMQLDLAGPDIADLGPNTAAP